MANVGYLERFGGYFARRQGCIDPRVPHLGDILNSSEESYSIVQVRIDFEPLFVRYLICVASIAAHKTTQYIDINLLFDMGHYLLNSIYSIL